MHPHSDGSPALSVGHGEKAREARAGCVAGCLMSGFFGVFLLAGVFILGTLLVYPIFQVILARSWDETPCTIISSEVVGGDDTFRIAISYSYEVGHQQYISDRYQFTVGSTSGRAGKQKVVDRYPPGTQTVCFVNPVDPSEAVIERGFIVDMLFGLLGLPFFLVGAGGLWFTTRRTTGSSPKARSLQGTTFDNDPDSELYDSAPPPGSPSRQHLAERIRATASGAPRIRAWSSSDFEDDDLEIPDEPVTLDPSSSPRMQFVGCLFGSLFVHVFIGIFFSSRWSDWMEGQWEFFPDVFAIPAAIVSLACIAGVVHAFLAMFNPRPVLTVSRQAIPLGGKVDLEWFFEGNPASIRTLKMTLEGMESATYRKGTNSTTDIEKFYTDVVYDSTDPTEISEGRVTITIPTDTMHSFYAAHNKILWQLVLKGEIPFWPDVTATFPIKVIPHESLA